MVPDIREAPATGRQWFQDSGDAMTETETENLSSLIGDIYDAAFDPALWPAILAEIVRFVGGQAGGLLTKDSVSRISTVHFETGVDPHQTDVYVKTYSKCDPMTPLRYFDIGQVASTDDLISYDEFRRGRFYLEWVKPQRWVDSASIVLEKSETNFAYFSVIRDAKTGMVDAATRRRMRLIAQHVRRAVLIG